MSYYDDNYEDENEIMDDGQQGNGQDGNNENLATKAANRIKERALKNKVPVNTKGSAGKSIKDRAKNAVKNAAKNAGKAIKEAWKKVPLGLKIKIYLIGGIAAIIILLASALITILNSTKNTSQTVSSVATNYKEMVANGTFPGDKDQIEQALNWLNKDGTFIGFTKDQINAFYEANIASLEGGSTSELQKAYESHYGTKNSSELGGKISVEEKLPLYKHILNIEKYNFNEIKWKAYNHSTPNGAEISKDNLSYDTTIDLYYPNDGKTELKSLVDLAKPYLLNWRFPVAFASASSYEDARANQLATTMYKRVEDENNQKFNTIGDFAYQIVKEGRSDITIDQYQMNTCTLRTNYDIYREKSYNDTFTVTYTTIKYPQRNEDGSVKTGENGETLYENEQFQNDTRITNATNGGATFDQDYNNLEEKNSRKDDAGNEQVSLEKEVSRNTVTDYTYYVSHALAYDIVKDNQYSYVTYSNSDVDNRTGEDSANEEQPQDYTEVVNKDNRYFGNEGKVNNTSQIDAIKSAYNATATGGGNPGPQNQDGSVTTTYTYTVTTGNYTIQRGQHHYINRVWADKLNSSGAKSVKLTLDDVIKYNKNEEGNPNKSTETEESFNAETQDVEYYEGIAAQDLEYLNKIDLLNSNPGIIKNYLDGGQKASKYIGYKRADFVYSQGMKSLTELLDELAGEKKTVPFVYGTSLGYGTVGGGSSSSYLTGMQLLKAYLRSREGHEGIADENGKALSNSQMERAKYYRVGLVWNGTKSTRTVGYGVDLDTSGYEPQIQAAMGVSTPFQEGDLIPIEIVDKCEEDEIMRAIEAVNAEFSDVELKEYQLHALVSRYYNCGCGGWKWSNWSPAGLTIKQAYTAGWHEDTDDKYKELYDQYRDNQSAKSEIVANADYNNKFYADYMITPTNGGILVTRRQSEWILFSLGYYDSLQRFWSSGGGTPGGIDLYNSDGSINETKVAELTNWFVDNFFGGADSMRFSGTGGYKTSGNHFAGVTINTAEYPFFSNGLEEYQCTWWARCRASYQAWMMDPDNLGNYIHTSGNGGYVAENTAKYYKVPWNMNIREIKPHSLVSYREGNYRDSAGNICGHIAYVEAVDYNKGIYYQSHCGGGTDWYGTTIKYMSDYEGANAYKFGGFVTMEDIVNSDVYKGGNK